MNYPQSFLGLYTFRLDISRKGMLKTRSYCGSSPHNLLNHWKMLSSLAQNPVFPSSAMLSFKVGPLL